MLALHPSDLARLAKVFDRMRLKKSATMQMLRRLPVALALVKACNTSENLFSEVRQITYYLYQAKEITKKVCNYIMNSVKV